MKHYTLNNLPTDRKPKILLIYLNRNTGNVQETYDEPAPDVHLRPLLGLQYLAAATRSIDTESIILDQRVIHFEPADIINYINNKRIILLGFYTSYSLTGPNTEFIKQIRAYTDIPIIVGGPGYHDYRVLLDAGADIIVRHEGEETLKEIIKKTQNKSYDWSSIDGIYYSSKKKIISNKDRSPIKNIDTISWPLRDNLVPITAYKDYYLMGIKLPYITMITSRGCPHTCSYCGSPDIWQNVVRQRSVESVLAEIDYAVDKWGIRYIDMLDDVFGMKYEWVEEFCKKLSSRNYDLHYKILINPTTFGNRQERCLELLSKSGCNIVGIGMQTADKDTLESIGRKRESPQKLIEAVNSVKKYGMLSFVNFICGFPDEPGDTPQKIATLVDQAGPLLIDCYPLIYLKGTRLYDALTNMGIDETYSFKERLEKAVKIKKWFYSSPVNLFKILIWIIRRNPSWLLFLLRHFIYIFKISGFSRTLKESS
jgi:radical SAM superfamily enzyme YgiQ (UPF0313 family)